MILQLYHVQMFAESFFFRIRMGVMEAKGNFHRIWIMVDGKVVSEIEGNGSDEANISRCRENS